MTMSLFHADKDANNGGYLIGTCLFMALFIATVVIQITMKRFHPLDLLADDRGHDNRRNGDRPISQTVRWVSAISADHRSYLRP